MYDDMSTFGGDEALTRTSAPGGLLDRGEHVVAEPVDELRRRLVLRAALRRDEPAHRASGCAGSLGCGPRTDSTSGSAATASLTAASAPTCVGAVDLGDEVDRSGRALAEAVDDEVVRLLGRRVVGEVALVGEPEPQAEHRDGEHEQDRGGRDGRGPRAVLDDAAPAVGDVSRRGLGGRCCTSRFSGATKNPSTIVSTASAKPSRISAGISSPAPTRATATNPAATSPRHFVRSMLSPAKPSSAGSSVIDAATVTATVTDAVMPSPPTKPMPMSSMPEQRDDDRRAREHDRTPRGVHRDADRLANVVARVQLLAIARDDQQRVVDADAEADHQADERREVGDLDEVAGEDDERAAEADAEQRDADRQAHREHRPERDDQDDDGEREAEQLGRRLFELGEAGTRRARRRRPSIVGDQIAQLLADVAGAA